MTYDLKSFTAAGRQMGRRELMKSAAIMGAAFSAGGLLLPRKAAAAPKRGGHCAMAHAHGSTTDNLDPGAGTNDFMYSLVFACNNFLTELREDGQLVGELAQEFHSTPDASKWTFVLRKGVKFHNGQEVKAKDVIASLNHHRGEKSSSAAKPLLQSVKEISSPDDHTVVVELSNGNADLPTILSTYQFPIKPEKNGAMDWESGTGCGAYVLKKFQPGVSAQLERNAGYWKADRAWFDTIEILTVADSSARSNALVTGQVHLISRPDIRFVDRLAKAPGIVVEETQGNSNYGFPAMLSAAPFNDRNVMTALKLAINRKEMVEKVLFGHGSLGNDSPIGPTYRYFATEAEVPQRNFDPDKSKFYLKKAGHDRLAITMNIAEAAFPGAIDAALLYKESAAQCGIDINVVRDPEDGYWSNTWNVKPFTGIFWYGYPTEDMILSVALQTGAPWNSTKFSNKRFDELLLKARSELQDSLRREMYVEMQKIVHDEDGAVTPMFNNFLWARSDKLGHGEALSKNMDIDGQRWCERWWFA